MPKAVTLSDVAREAGVDLSTASRVLRGTGRVSATTRQRILDAADRLDFRPNAQAQFLATGISKTVGVLTINGYGTFTLPVLAGLTSTLGQQDVATLLYDVREDPEILQESVKKFRARQIDGLLVLGDGLQAPLHSVTANLQVPVVYAFATSDSPDDSCFMPDGEMAGRIAAEHLLALGRRRIATVTAADDIAAADRTRGLVETIRSAGGSLALDQPLERDWTRLWGAEAAERIADRIDEVDAVFCGNDQIALGILGVLRARGIRVPEDVALVGYDNWEGMVGQGNNLLTTVDPRLSEIGAAAARALVHAIDGSAAPGAHHEPCELVTGESTLGVGAAGPRDATTYR
ncbi:LacI family DNA-binding transcriptional regulator [Curtobacterium pusillum]|uniref:LacI family DNA-binding transcriptional regulator n=1 Tax=Curtobacterium pusillum TaxID=69373 RepID=A0AAW3T3M5_9MICO|nr:LacI family DNA-binding transcriptional regulator [Curtobacterium pusillum]MBA8989476.1 LacI family transcriptional regulator [Curtobacterium pusillum]NUU15031.1 LacI family DNA-binding transcriptional regulator [Curtobacterium pusillum]GLK32593.1 LacI family transcriptional regulator [Curtobacterium pusillum]